MGCQKLWDVQNVGMRGECKTNWVIVHLVRN